jgi:predicted ATPase
VLAGQVAEAREHLEQAIALYDPQQHRAHAFRYGRDPGSDCRLYAAFVLWWLGYPDQGLRHLQEALPLAQALSHPFSLATVLLEAALVHYMRREADAAQARAEAAIAVSTEQGFPLWLAFGTVLRGGALGMQGQGEEGITQLRQGLDALRANGAEYIRPYCLAMLSEAYDLSGQMEAGLAAVAEALAAVEATGERFWEAELHRLKGGLLSGIGTQVSAGEAGAVREPSRQIEAEACFRQALDIARRQGAKGYELRTAVSLGRLWQRQGKRDEARQLLAEVYDWFTEGFDTADLQEAKALLAQWSR